MKFTISMLALALACLQCASPTQEKNDVLVIKGATLIDGTGAPATSNTTIVIQGGTIQSIGDFNSLEIPDGATVVDASGKFVMPGLINAHGHIGGTNGLVAGYSAENVIRDLRLSAVYGITTVFSLGGDELPSVSIRDKQDTVALERSRLYVAGDVVTGNTPEEARLAVDKNAANNVDVIKIRVDDNLGTTEKMSPEVYAAVIDQAKKHNLPVAAHIFYLEDAKALVKLGARMIAHSVRDKEVDDEFVQLMIVNKVYYCPTLMREVSTFVYESTPTFFDDPFFLKEADTTILNQLKQADRQQRIKESKSAQAYKEALRIAKLNLKTLADQGVLIAMGTDTGPPARFQGYFEHLELEQMADAGLSANDILKASTKTAAEAIGHSELGTLKAGNKADFLILNQNPLEDVKNARSIESVWIGGHQVDQNSIR
ncbi:MAG: amidohydrolase family protein [Cyclobacteriaceae bacterium]